MLNIMVRLIICFALFLLQNFFSSRKTFVWLFTLPVFSIIGGILYVACSKNIFSLTQLVPFLVLAVCLTILGLFERSKYQKRELDKMKAQDINEI